MTRQHDLSPARTDPVQLLSDQLRQSLRVCSAHPAGPLAAFDRCLVALRTGTIDADQFHEIGRRLVRASRRRVAEHDANGGIENTQLRNEVRLVQFVSALFTLDENEVGGL